MASLSIVKGLTYGPAPGAPGTIDFEELKSWARSGRLIRMAFHYDDVQLRTQRLETLTKPLATASLLRILSRRSCRIVDAYGQVQEVDAISLSQLLRDHIRDRVALGRMVHETEEAALALASNPSAVTTHLAIEATPVFLRSDHVFGIEAGGSVGHIAGVLNNLGSFSGQPLFITTDLMPTVDDAIETVVVLPEPRFRDFPDAPLIAFNDRLIREATRAIGSRAVSFIYQRYSAYNFAGVRLSRVIDVPFVLEYNGSEVWINRNWGRPLRYEGLARRIEALNLRAADLVVTVSDVIRDEALEQGVDPDRVLVNPNGVDPEQYRPDIDGRPTRERLGIRDDLVLGFIGTFGRWHGAENLAIAFGRLLDRHPELAGRVRLLMIGDGVGLPETRRIVEASGHADRVIFTGRVPQVEGPSYLAACDILVSPHVPNVDGSRFFGSPTKLFEYMAMGKPIVASALEQIADVLEDGRTAVLVKPGDIDDLVRGMKVVIDSPELGARLGVAARAQAVEHHTWREHTRRIVDGLKERCA